MKVLKFGGSSVANEASIAKVISIVKNEPQSTVVVSALGGVTDMLVGAMHHAASGSDQYKDVFPTLTQRHLDLVKAYIPIDKQSSIISFIKVEINRLETLLDGVFMLQEATQKASSKVTSFGEVLSSKIITAIFNENGIKTRHINGRECIQIDHLNGRIDVQWEATSQKVNAYFSEKFEGVSENCM